MRFLETIQPRLPLALSLVALLTLAGCGDDVLDWRNAQISNGKVYEGSANKPFSGQVTNVPYSKVLGGQAGYQQLIGQGEAIVAMLFGSAVLCDVKVNDGVLKGEAVYRRPQQTEKAIEANFDNGLLTGKFVMRDAKTGNTVAETTFKEGKIDGVLKRYDPKTQKQTLEQSVKAGVAKGRLKQWDGTTGQLLLDASFSKGVPDGKYLQNDIYSNELLKGSYKNGRFTGDRTRLDYTDGTPNPETLISRITEKVVDDKIVNQAEEEDEFDDKRLSFPEESNACTDAFRKSADEDAMINYALAWKFVDNCRAGKRP